MSAPPNIPQFRPSHHDMRWQERALCRDVDAELFFAKQGQEREAVAICRRCPVRVDCLTHALEKPEDAGIWGRFDSGAAARYPARHA